MQSLQYHSRLSAAKDTGITHAAAAPSNLDAAMTMRYRDIELQNTIVYYVQRREKLQLENRISAPKQKITILKHFFRGIYRKITSAKLNNSIDKWLSQPWCSHFYTIHSSQLQKTIVLRTPRRQATLTQPSQCILQHDVANPHVSTRMATPDDNNHNGSHYGNLQPEIQQAKRTTHKWTTARCRTQRRNRLRAERPQPQPPHTGVTGGTFHRRLQPLYTEKHKVSCSGFLPNTSAMQDPCSHHNAFCSMT